jgi:hypothetical protein
MVDEVPSPTFSDRVKRARAAEALGVKKVVKLPAFPDVIRAHHLPLVLKSRSGDSLQVYLTSYAKNDKDGCFVYDVEFDDGSRRIDVPRAALSIPPETSYQMMRLQGDDSQQTTPPRVKKSRR